MKKNILALLTVISILTMFVGCSSNTNKTQSNENSNPKASTLTMYTNAEFAPFEYFEGEKVVGVDADIAKIIAAAAGSELKIQHTDFDSLVPSLVAGKADFVAAAMTITPERMEEVDFSIPYVESIQHIISLNESNYTTMDDLKGKKIGVQLGTTGDLMVSDAINLDDGALKGSGSEVKPYSSPLEAAQDLLTGRIDAVVVDKLTAEEISKNNSDQLTSVKFGEISESYGIAVAKGNKELLEIINNTLQKLLDEGKIEELIEKHSN